MKTRGETSIAYEPNFKEPEYVHSVETLVKRPSLSEQLNEREINRVTTHNNWLKHLSPKLKIIRLITATILKRNGVQHPLNLISQFEINNPSSFVDYFDYDSLRERANSFGDLENPTVALQRARYFGVNIRHGEMHWQSTELNELSKIPQENIDKVLNQLDKYYFLTLPESSSASYYSLRNIKPFIDILKNGEITEAQKKILDLILQIDNYLIKNEDKQVGPLIQVNFKDIDEIVNLFQKYNLNLDLDDGITETDILFLTTFIELSSMNLLYSGYVDDLLNSLNEKRSKFNKETKDEILQEIWIKYRQEHSIGQSLDSITGIANFLEIANSAPLSIQRMMVDEIASIILLGKVVRRTDIERISVIVKSLLRDSSLLSSQDVHIRGLFAYILNSFPLNSEQEIDGELITILRREALDIQGINIHKYEGIHQMIHNYPTPLNLDVIKAILHKYGEEYERLREQLAREARPELSRSEVERGIEVEAYRLLESLERHLIQFYYPSPQKIQSNLKEVKEFLDPDLFKIVDQNLEYLANIKNLKPDEVISYAINIGNIRRSIQSEITRLDNKNYAAIAPLLQADRLLQQSTELIFGYAINLLEAKVTATKGVLSKALVVQLVGVFNGIVTQLEVSGIPSEGIPKIIYDSQSDLDPKLVLDILGKVALPISKIAYIKTWREIINPLVPYLIHTLVKNNEPFIKFLTANNTDPYVRKIIGLVHNIHLVNFYKTSPLYSLENELRHLNEICNLLSEAIKTGSVTESMPSQSNANMYLKEVSENADHIVEEFSKMLLRDLPWGIANQVSKFLFHRSSKEIQRSSLSIDQVIQRQNIIASSEFAQAYSLLEISLGGKINRKKLAKRGFFITEAYGIPILIIIQHKQMIFHPLEFLKNEIHIVPAMLNYARNRWRGD